MKKRVLMLNYEFPPIGGGAATATFNMLRVLSCKKDIEIDLITSSKDIFKQEIFAENIQIHFLDIGKNNKVHLQSNKDLLTYTWKAFWYCRKLKKTKEFDLTHAFFGIPCGFVAMLLGLPYIISLRGSDVPFYSKKYRVLDIFIFSWLSKIIWHRAKRVLTNSEGLKQLALKTKPKQEIGVIYNGVDTSLFAPGESKNKEEFIVVSTSRLIERKGIDLLLKAFLQFTKGKDDAKLLIAGDGDLKDKLITLVKKSEEGHKVAFLGALTRKEMPSLYQNSDVFVLPSLNEGMSNSLLESMASGLSVIATDTGGTKELLNNENGIIIEKGSIASIVGALEKLYSNRELLGKMKKSGRQKALAMSWEKMVEQYLEIY